MGFGFGFGFHAFEGMFTLVFVLVIGLFIYAVVQAIARKQKNDASPRLTVLARVVSRRQEVTHHARNMNDGVYHTSSTTRYFVTFQVESGDRMELELDGSDFGMIAEGDEGRLSFQGTRFLDFQRT